MLYAFSFLHQVPEQVIVFVQCGIMQVILAEVSYQCIVILTVLQLYAYQRGAGFLIMFLYKFKAGDIVVGAQYVRR